MYVWLEALCTIKYNITQTATAAVEYNSLAGKGEGVSAILCPAASSEGAEREGEWLGSSILGK